MADETRMLEMAELVRLLVLTSSMVPIKWVNKVKINGKMERISLVEGVNSGINPCNQCKFILDAKEKSSIHGDSWSSVVSKWEGYSAVVGGSITKLVDSRDDPAEGGSEDGRAQPETVQAEGGSLQAAMREDISFGSLDFQLAYSFKGMQSIEIAHRPIKIKGQLVRL
ncbi:hypothetical protein VNO78_18617 [Psophocarpus tetragonolobus]|uniref:Uncharacterized protein n=1 Tax=Psophocarpus tetragonolobus TaxID=3891 RepID=A0AAN9SJN2_PSOTE